MTLDTLTVRTVVAAIFFAVGLQTHIKLDKGLPYYSPAQVSNARMASQRLKDAYKITSRRWPYDLTK